MKTSPFSVNWHDLAAVKSYAQKLGKGMTVYKKSSRNNYNITHTSRTDLYQPEEVVFQTQSINPLLQ